MLRNSLQELSRNRHVLCVKGKGTEKNEKYKQIVNQTKDSPVRRITDRAFEGFLRFVQLIPGH